MLYVIGLGLSDEKDITVKGLEVRVSSRHRCAVSDFDESLGGQKVRAGLPRVVHVHPDDFEGEAGA